MNFLRKNGNLVVKIPLRYTETRKYKPTTWVVDHDEKIDRDYRGSGCAVGDGMPCFCCAQSIFAAGTAAVGQAGTEKADGQGVAFSATTRTGQEDRRKLNERGLYPEVVSTVKGRAESTTKAGISAGSVIIREGEKQI